MPFSLASTTTGSVGPANAACSALLTPDVTAANTACGGNFTIPTSLNVLNSTLTPLIAQLGAVCTVGCQAAIATVATDFFNPVCNATNVDASFTAYNITGADAGLAALLFADVGCVKDQAGAYCLLSEETTLLPLLANVSNVASLEAALIPLAANKTLLCSYCVLQQVSAINASLINFPASLQATLAPIGLLVAQQCGLTTLPTNNTAATSASVTATTAPAVATKAASSATSFGISASVFIVVASLLF